MKSNKAKRKSTKQVKAKSLSILVLFLLFI